MHSMLLAHPYQHPNQAQPARDRIGSLGPPSSLSVRGCRSCEGIEPTVSPYYSKWLYYAVSSCQNTAVTRTAKPSQAKHFMRGYGPRFARNNPPNPHPLPYPDQSIARLYPIPNSRTFWPSFPCSCFTSAAVVPLQWVGPGWLEHPAVKAGQVTHEGRKPADLGIGTDIYPVRGARDKSSFNTVSDSSAFQSARGQAARRSRSSRSKYWSAKGQESSWELPKPALLFARIVAVRGIDTPVLAPNRWGQAAM